MTGVKYSDGFRAEHGDTYTVLVTTDKDGQVISEERLPDDFFILGPDDLPKNKHEVLGFLRKFTNSAPARPDGQPLNDDDLQSLYEAIHEDYANRRK